MTTINTNYISSDYYARMLTQQSSKEKVSKKEAAESSSAAEKTQLSKAAQEVLEKIKEKYSDMDIFVADFSSDEEAEEIMSRGTKEFSVLFSPDELEKMASSEEYLEEKMGNIDDAVLMSQRINEQLESEDALGEDAQAGSVISKLGISFNDDGSVSYFAELEKSSEKQKERIEEARENRAEEKKEAAKKDKAKEGKEAIGNKRVTVEASSEEELLQKIMQIDWSEIKEEQQEVSGSRFDFSI